MATFIVTTTSSVGFRHYFPDVSVEEFKYRCATALGSAEKGEYSISFTVFTTEIDSIEDLLRFTGGKTKVGNWAVNEIVIGSWHLSLDIVHPEDVSIVEYLNTLPFLEIYDYYRE